MSKFLFGEETDDRPLVSKAYGLAVFEGAVYVPDMGQAGYGVFDMAAGKTRLVRPGGAGAMKKPANIDIDSDGTRYITDTGRNQVLVFDRQDRYLRAFGTEGQFKPGDVLIVGERLYVSDLEGQQILVLDKLTGEVLFSFGEGGVGPGQFIHPTNLTLGPDETLWVTDTNNYRLQQFTLEGDFIASVGELGRAPGQFTRPKGLAVDQEGLLYAVDAGFQNVQILDTDGTPLLFFGRPGGDKSSLSMPAGVVIDYKNIQYFQKYAHPDFEIEYLVLVANQFGENTVVVFGFGSLNQ